MTYPGVKVLIYSEQNLKSVFVVILTLFSLLLKVHSKLSLGR